MSRSTNPVSIEGLTVAEAAKHYKISNNAVRKRIQRGTINARKIGGQWRIFVDVPENERTAASPGYGREAADAGPPDASLALAEQQLAVFRDTFVTPLIEEIGDLKYRLGSAENELGHVQRENIELKERIQELESTKENLSDGESADEEQNDLDEPERTEPTWWQFWRWYA